MANIETYTLFVDAQNVYNSARYTFFSGEDSRCYGQIDIVKLAKLIESRYPYDNVLRQLKEIRVYTGIPNVRTEQFTYNAYINQKNACERDGIKVIARPLRYLPGQRPQQKGVDVQLTIDFIILAIDCYHDVGILVSADTDLRPALELVKTRCKDKCKVEVVGIDGGDNRHKRALYSRDTHCYWINKTDYDQIAYLTSYSGREIHRQLSLDTNNSPNSQT